eukprot:CAMPEP_0197678708 /NCGR_PEP_ID=MMETSP1338-20131121/90498_1 /TAXON_ID=43686 ORGANISM="Pelagodinium beii, Strain RCC1491" /NCGR_SAMPLE_ID=MMETSP1338 /ASSEMBLY_ACC=CAM_ASM_000754 /LENGTH=40 /DNA_ID= /DNA_START= /DNA_END= /DNA_ORIENTATION=
MSSCEGISQHGSSGAFGASPLPSQSKLFRAEQPARLTSWS